MKTSIRKCTLDELKTLLEISYETFVDAFQSMNIKETMDKYVEEAFNMEKLEEELRNMDSRFFFLYADDELAGYLKINESPSQTDINNPDSIEVERIYIKKEFKGKGLGRQLINYAIQLAKEMKKNYVWLGVWEKNINAIAFYKRLGFYEDGRHPFKMGDELQSDFIMKKTVSDSK